MLEVIINAHFIVVPRVRNALYFGEKCAHFILRTHFTFFQAEFYLIIPFR